MGQHGSKLKVRGQKHQHSKSNEVTQENGIRINLHEEFQGTSPETFEKLLAYIIDMAENDDVDLTSQSYLEHLKEIYGTDKTKSQLNARATQTICQKSSKTQRFPIRQHSLESNGNSPRCSRSSWEDTENLKSSIRGVGISHQGTFDFNDDIDEPCDSLEDSNLGGCSHIIGPKSLLIENMEETSFTHTSFGEHRSKKTMRSSAPNSKVQQISRQDCAETFLTVLDDEILDRNIADILFSVEALWPGVRK